MYDNRAIIADRFHASVPIIAACYNVLILLFRLPTFFLWRQAYNGNKVMYNKRVKLWSFFLLKTVLLLLTTSSFLHDSIYSLPSGVYNGFVVNNRHQYSRYLCEVLKSFYHFSYINLSHACIKLRLPYPDKWQQAALAFFFVILLHWTV